MAKSKWDEMEDYENGIARLTISTPCWLGQFCFGILASTLFGGFGNIIFTASTAWRNILLVSGTTLGVFSGSSGGGNPCETISGGGLYAVFFIYTMSITAVTITQHFFMLIDSIIALSFCSSAVGVISGGVAASFSNNFQSHKKKKNELEPLTHTTVLVLPVFFETISDEISNPEAISRNLGVLVLAAAALVLCGGWWDLITS